MEEFDIEEELENLEGKSIIEKCEALDNLCDSLEEALNESIEAKASICDEYEESCCKKFENEIKLFINTKFHGQKPDLGDKCCCTFSYNGASMLVIPMCCDGEWSIKVSITGNQVSRKPEQELIRKLGGDVKTGELLVSEEAVVPKIELALSFADGYIGD